MNMLSDIQIGLAVKSARLAADLSAKQLAEQSGLTSSALSKIETGKQALGFAEAAEICSALGVRVDHLLALAREVEPIATETASLRDQLRHDLRELEQQTIKAAVALGAAKRAEVLA